jgi:aminomethyltransferase
VQAGLAWTVKPGRPGGFVGEEVLAAELRAGPERRVVWFRTGDRRIARPGTPVLSGGAEVGML